METCVLIPQEFSLVVTTAGARNSAEQTVTAWSSTRIKQGTLYYPFQGTVRIDKLNIYSYITEDDVSNKKKRIKSSAKCNFDFTNRNRLWFFKMWKCVAYVCWFNSFINWQSFVAFAISDQRMESVAFVHHLCFFFGLASKCEVKKRILPWRWENTPNERLKEKEMTITSSSSTERQWKLFVILCSFIFCTIFITSISDTDANINIYGINRERNEYYSVAFRTINDDGDRLIVRSACVL